MRSVMRLPPGRPALFLDRDGAVVEDTEYLCRAEDIVMIPGAAAVIAAANRLGIAVVLVTNQAGIGRGYYGWAEFKTVQQAIVAALAREGARLDAVYACAHHPEGAMVLLILTIRRASQIRACCCKRRPILPSISKHHGLSATRPPTSRPPSAPACRRAASCDRPRQRRTRNVSRPRDIIFPGPLRPIDRRCDDAADFVAATIG